MFWSQRENTKNAMVKLLSMTDWFFEFVHEPYRSSRQNWNRRRAEFANFTGFHRRRGASATPKE